MATHASDDGAENRSLASDFESELHAALPDVRTLLRRLTGASHDADDLAQEVWLRAQRYRASFDAGGSMSGWLAKMAFRQFLDWRRRRERAPRALGEGDRELVASAHDDLEQRDWLQQRLALLRPVERDVLLAFHREGESVAEVAARFRMPEGTVRSHLHRARRRLAEEEHRP